MEKGMSKDSENSMTVLISLDAAYSGLDINQ